LPNSQLYICLPERSCAAEPKRKQHSKGGTARLGIGMPGYPLDWILSSGPTSVWRQTFLLLASIAGKELLWVSETVFHIQKWWTSMYPYSKVTYAFFLETIKSYTNNCELKWNWINGTMTIFSLIHSLVIFVYWLKIHPTKIFQASKSQSNPFEFKSSEKTITLYEQNILIELIQFRLLFTLITVQHVKYCKWKLKCVCACVFFKQACLSLWKIVLSRQVFTTELLFAIFDVPH